MSAIVTGLIIITLIISLMLITVYDDRPTPLSDAERRLAEFKRACIRHGL